MPPFDETSADYAARLRTFAKAHPDVTADDLKALFPSMNSASAIWAKFNADALAHAKARTKAGSAP